MVLEAVKLISYYCCNTDLGILWKSPTFKIKKEKEESEYTVPIRKQMLKRYLGTRKEDSLISCVFLSSKWSFEV